MIFDTHAHVLSPDRVAYPYGTLRGGATVPVGPMVYPVEELVAAMDVCGVVKAAIVQRATIYGYDNSYALDASAQYPERFAPVIVLDAQDPGSPAELRRLAAEHRLGGVRLAAPELNQADTEWLDGPDALAFWATAADLSLPVAVIIYRFNNEAGRAALLGIAQRFPRVAILADHVGLPHPSNPEKAWCAAKGYDCAIPTGPDFGIAEHLAQFGNRPNVYFKVSDINFDRLEEAGIDLGSFVRVLADRFGAERLVWGSDIGQSPKPYDKKVERLHEAGTLLDEAERAAFFGGNAQRLYPTVGQR